MTCSTGTLFEQGDGDFIAPESLLEEEEKLRQQRETENKAAIKVCLPLCDHHRSNRRSPWVLFDKQLLSLEKICWPPMSCISFCCIDKAVSRTVAPYNCSNWFTLSSMYHSCFDAGCIGWRGSEAR